MKKFNQLIILFLSEKICEVRKKFNQLIIFFLSKKIYEVRIG